jgi:hypothetical protein
MKLSATTSIIFIANTFLPANGTGVFAGFYSPTTNFRLNSLGRIHIKQMQIIVWHSEGKTDNGCRSAYGLRLFNGDTYSQSYTCKYIV